jgi:lipid-binding SYLF domain-containing protein
MRRPSWIVALLVLMLIPGVFIRPNLAPAATAEELNREVVVALEKLYEKSPTAKALGEKAKGILVFPGIVKAGFLIGGQYGEGALVMKGSQPGSYRIPKYFSTVQVSYGLQAGAQKFGYALFFMSDSAMEYLSKSDGWELGTGPTIAVVDVGAAASLSTTTLQSDINAFFFSQQGLMAGIGLQGTKVTEIEK